jgi:hypothetical protein
MGAAVADEHFQSLSAHVYLLSFNVQVHTAMFHVFRPDTAVNYIHYSTTNNQHTTSAPCVHLKFVFIV